MRNRSLLLFTPLLLSAVLSAQEPTPAAFRTAGDRPIDVDHLRLDVAVDLEKQALTGTATLTFTLLQPRQQVTLDAVDLEVSAVRGGKLAALNTPPTEPLATLAFDATGSQLHVNLGTVQPRGQAWQVAIDYRLEKPKDGLYFFAPTLREPKTPIMAWTQGEPISNRHWFPCLDQPNERQTTEVLATVPAGFEALSNGSLIAQTALDDGRVRFHWKQQATHVAYLVTLVVGRFHIGREMWRDKPVLYYVPPERAEDMQRTFGHTREMLDYFSKRFGVDYPWEKYAQVVVEQFVAGGMENTSATTLYSDVMHSERALRGRDADWLIAHELGHQWWGDLLTCKDWAHLWLNEGFATLCESLWDEHKHGADEYAWSMYQNGKEARDPNRGAATRRPIVDHFYTHPSEMFDNRVYPKGAFVLHMLRCQLGDELFFEGVKTYAEAHRYQVVETGDLRAVFERLSGRAFDRFFYDWTARPGHPAITLSTEYLANDGLLKVDVKQTQKADAFHLPLRLEIHCPNCSQPEKLERLLTEKEATFYLPLTAAPRMICVDPKQAILADWTIKHSEAVWEVLAKEGPTVVDRLHAVQHWGDKTSAKARTVLAGVLTDDAFHGVRSQAAAALGKIGGSEARDLLLARLAEEKDHRVRKSLVEALGKFDKDEVVIKDLLARAQARDDSDHVEAAILQSLAAVTLFDRTPEVAAVFRTAVERESWSEVIRRAAFAGLRTSADPADQTLLFEWTKPERPHQARTEAMAALADSLTRLPAEPARLQAIVRSWVEYLVLDQPRVRRATAEALGRLGSDSKAALPTLQRLAEDDPNRRVRDAAKQAIAKIEAGPPTPLDLKQLRDQLRDYDKRNTELKERLDRLENKRSP